MPHLFFLSSKEHQGHDYRLTICCVWQRKCPGAPVTRNGARRTLASSWYSSKLRAKHSTYQSWRIWKPAVPPCAFCNGASGLSSLIIFFVQVSMYDWFSTQTCKLWIQPVELMTVGTIIRNMYAKTPG